ncbi:MAG: hypothetical protein KGH58_04585 [Candidatus Micrarchaeota archaeon]|nr:hypothetical protein [Candidatus Micrarchaeota archaeon]
MTQTITISVDEEAARTLRRIALHRYGRKKGSLGKTASAAIMALSAMDQNEEVNRRALERLKKGHNFGKLLYLNRAELHER